MRAAFDPRAVALLCALFAPGCGASKASQRSALTEPTEVAPAPTRMLHAEIMEDICEPEHLEGDTCKVCPDDEDMQGPLRLVTSRAGAYSKPGAREHLVLFEGCTIYPDDEAFGEDRPPNMYTLAAYQERDGEFDEVGSFEGLDIERCVFPKLADETEAIFCVEEMSDIGIFTSSVVLIDTNYWDTDAYSTLTSDVGSCPELGMGYIDEELVSLSVLDLDSDGLDDVYVEAIARSGDIPDAYPNYCAAAADGQILEAKEPTSFHYIQIDGAFEEPEDYDP